VARTVFDNSVCSIVVAAGETGSEVGNAAMGFHFSQTTSRGAVVQKGEPIAGIGDGNSSIPISLPRSNGELDSIRDIDDKVLRAVSRQVASGIPTLLFAMNHSKLGAKCPSDECISEIVTRWPGRVQIVVDASQLRLSRTKLRAYLTLGCMVAITGSKFVGGPPFSGALLVPAALSEVMRGRRSSAIGLRDYSSRPDWPVGWDGARAPLPVMANIGQFLRWTVALAEMRGYFSLSTPLRMRTMEQFRATVLKRIGGLRNFKLLESTCQEILDDKLEMVAPTIFPFFILRNGKPMPLAGTRIVYRAMNRDLSACCPTKGDGSLAKTSCLIGQPVGVELETGVVAGALRLSCSARDVVHCHNTDKDPGDDESRSAALEAKLSIVFEKLQFILDNFARIAKADSDQVATQPEWLSIRPP
jgi:hypothetical protein